MGGNDFVAPTRGRVLIAEDEAVTALSLEQALIDHGYEVCGLAATGKAARILAESERPTIAIVDVRLRDGTTGHEAAQDIHTLLGIPVILMSGHSDEAKARQIGAIGFLPKPFAHDSLLQMVDRALRLLRGEGRCASGLLIPNHFIDA
jgi:DNA-binding NtrC family response regulator